MLYLKKLHYFENKNKYMETSLQSQRTTTTISHFFKFQQTFFSINCKSYKTIYNIIFFSYLTRRWSRSHTYECDVNEKILERMS